jgi:hypothetical protein
MMENVLEEYYYQQNHLKLEVTIPFKNISQTSL